MDETGLPQGGPPTELRVVALEIGLENAQTLSRRKLPFGIRRLCQDEPQPPGGVGLLESI